MLEETILFSFSNVFSLRVKKEEKKVKELAEDGTKEIGRKIGDIEQLPFRLSVE